MVTNIAIVFISFFIEEINLYTRKSNKAMERYLKLVGILLAVILSPVWIWATLSFIGAAVVIPLMLMNVECHCILDRLCESNETFVREAWKVGLAVVLIIASTVGFILTLPRILKLMRKNCAKT